MRILPAIDLKGGRCVRLLRGDMAAETVYGDDPVAMGRRWVAEGADYLHVVDLDGAVRGEPVNDGPIARLAGELPIPIEVGGGIRSVKRAAELLDSGVERIIFGTVALTQPAVVAEACRRYPGRVAVGIDVRDGQVAVEGWTASGAKSAIEVARDAQEAGAVCIIYTDIQRDGTQEGVSVEATRCLARQLRIPVIASGGVGSLQDIKSLLPAEKDGVAGVIVGRALYTGAVRLPEALQLAGRGS